MPTPERNHNHNHERLDLRRDLHRRSLPPPPELYSPEKPKSKLLYFFLKAVIMIALGSCFFLIVGGGAILLLLFKLGPASTASRRRRFREHFPGSDAEFSREDLCELPRIKLSCDPPESADECVVCLSNLADGDWCRILPDCGHKFHADCIDNWLVKASVCPICRRGVRLDRDSIEAGIRREKSKQLWIGEVSI